jgi:AcrR family transcriptional regulator
MAQVSNDVQRRASYGPTSPALGWKGAKTRQRIIEVALEVFGRRGYHGTVVDDLAEAVGLSRATLYQYFEGKEDIFAELVEASGAETLKVSRRIGPLGPSADGYAALRGWLTEWAQVFGHFEAAFVQWADADSPATTLRRRMRAFVDSNTAAIAGAFRSGGADVDARAGAVLASAVIERYHYIRAVHDVGITASRLDEGLAFALQRTLFPTTSITVTGVPEVWSGSGQGPAPALMPPSDRFADRSPQARATAERIVDVACRVFAELGDGVASVDRIAIAAGTSRGIIYKYFDGREDLFGEAAQRCGQAMTVLCAELRQIDPADGRALRAWLLAFFDLHDRYAGVLRAWTRNDAVDRRVLEARDAVLRHALHGFSALRSRATEDARPDRAVAGLLFISCLERTPETASAATRPPARTALIEAQARFIERGLLGLG